MSGLPAGWAEARFPDIADVLDSRRVPLNARERAERQGPFPYYGANGLVDHIDGYLFEGEHVLLAEDGGHFDEPERGVAYEVDGQFWVNNHAHILQPVGDIECGFLTAWLNATNWMPHVGGSTRAKLTQAGLGEPIAPLPPLAEQRRIVAKLDALTVRTARARDDLAHIPALAARYKQAVLSGAFSGELVPFTEVAKGVTIEGIAAHIFDGPFGSNLKSDDYVASGVRVVRLENIAHLAFVGDKRTYITQAKFERLRRHSLQVDDVLFSSFVDEQVRVCVLPKLATPAINKADCFCIRLDRSRCDPRFIAYRLASRSTYEHFEAQVHGATRPRINLRQLKAFAFDLPPLDLQAEVVRRIESAFAEIDRLAAEAAAARRLLVRLDRAILAKAFRGELVPQDPTDEPASVLLDRIRAERASAPKPKRKRTGRLGNIEVEAA